MPLPIIFGPLTSISTTDFDENFAAVGALGVAPCSMTGTNAITLTPFADNPTISAYANYLVFSGVAAGTNTGPTTAALSGLGFVNVYTNTDTGPQVLAGGEIVVGNYIVLIYDSALNSGSGGFHLINGFSAGSFSALTVSGLMTAGTVSVGTSVVATAVNASSGTFGGSVVASLFNGSVVLASSSVSVSGAVISPTVTASVVSASIAAVSASLTIGGGTPIKKVLEGSASLTWTSIVPGASQDQSLTITGAAVGNGVILGMPASVTAGIAYDGRVAASNIVAVRATNATSGTVTPGAGTFSAIVMGF